MSYNHHVLAKLCSDTLLRNFRNKIWVSDVVSPQVRAVGSQSSFPSPDATFYDDGNSRIIKFEFKPPTETKRGMLTSIGQAVAYLDSSHIAFIFCPETVEGFDVATYFTRLFNERFFGKLPIGLIKYKNEDASKIELLVDIDPKTIQPKKLKEHNISDRYWAKHQDLPNSVLFELLDAAYHLPDSTNRKQDIWRKVWNDYIFSGDALNTLDKQPPHIFYHYGTPFELGAKKKAQLRSAVDKGELPHAKAIEQLKAWADPDKKGDCYATSYKKNFLTFIGHLNLWDDNGDLTPDGYDLHKTARMYGANSKVFTDELAKLTLFNGKHLDLILDLQEYSNINREASLKHLIKKFTDYYAEQGKIKFNPSRRKKEGQNEQFRYELIFWRKLNLLLEDYPENGPIAFNIREITRLCTENN